MSPWRVVLTISASVTACRILAFLFVCFVLFFLHLFSYPSSLHPWLWFVDVHGSWWCVWMEGQLQASQLFFLWKSACLVAVRGYYVLHGWIMRSDVVPGKKKKSLLSQSIWHGHLWLAVFFYVWHVISLMHDFQGGRFWEWDCCEKCGVISDASKKDDSLTMDVRNGWFKNFFLGLHTHFLPPLLKKNTILLWHFFFLFFLICWHGLTDFSCKWPWRSKAPCVRHLLWLLI